MKIVLLSGSVAAGKTSVSEALREDLGFRPIKTGAYLKSKALEDGVAPTRVELQRIGDALDELTDFAWVVDDVARPEVENGVPSDRWLLDSVRKARQIDHFRATFEGQVLHVHLTAPEQILRERYNKRAMAGGDYLGGTPYDVAINHPNEVASRGLVSMADLVFDSNTTAAKAIAIAIASKLQS